MKDIIFKLRILRWMLSHTFREEWLSHIWRKDLDQYACCNGRECCCGGETIRSIYSFEMKNESN